MQSTLATIPFGLSIDCPPHFSNYVESQMIERRPIEESKAHLVARRTLQGIASVAGTAARYPFFKIVLLYAGNNKILGYSLGIGSSLSFGAVITWCLLNIIDEYLRPMTEDEKQILRSRLPKHIQALIATAVFVMGPFSQLPLAYTSITYNNNNLLYGFGDIFVDSAYPIHSLHMNMKELLKQRHLSENAKRLLPLKDKLISKLEAKRSWLVHAEPKDRNACLKELQTIREREELAPRVDNLMRLLLVNMPSHRFMPDGKVINCGRWAVKGVGTVLGISPLIVAGLMSFLGAGLLSDNIYFRVSFAAFVIFCFIYLNFSITTNGLSTVYDAAVNTARGNPPKNLELSLYPKARGSLVLVSVASAFCAYVGPYKVCQDFFSGNFQTYMIATNIITSILLSLFAWFAISDDIVRNGGIKFGSTVNRQLLEFDNQLKRLIFLIRESPLVDFLKFLEKVPAETLEKWMRKLNITESDIRAYLRELETKQSGEEHEMREMQEGENIPMLELTS